MMGTVLHIDREAAEQLWGKVSLGQPMSESWPIAFATHREQATAVLVDALERVVSDCQLAHAALGNSPPQFDSVRAGLLIIRDRAAAAIALNKANDYA